MYKNQRGALNVLLIPLIASVLCFFTTLGFAVWAYAEREDYKNNSDKKANAAVQVARDKLSAEKDNEFLEKEKYPLVEYQGPAQFGSIKFSYPKTWSGYVSTTDDAFFVFNPNVVNAGDQTAQALRITVENSPYNDVIGQFDGQVQEGKMKATAYALPKVKDIVGLRFDGQIEEGKVASVIVLPLRDKTIKIASEQPDRFDDFNKIILANFTFSP